MYTEHEEKVNRLSTWPGWPYPKPVDPRKGLPTKKNKQKCPKGLRKRVHAAFASTCQYCGWQPSQPYIGSYNCLTVDRILPGIEGGKYAPDNVTLSCLLCNSFRASGNVYGPVRPLSVMEASNAE